MSDVFAHFHESAVATDASVLRRMAAWVGHRFAILTAGAALQIGALAAMIVLHAVPFVFGERILLHVRPVDPRDMFRGDFVILSYDFSSVPDGGIEGAPRTADPHVAHRYFDEELIDRAIYVELSPEPDGKHYRAGKISLDRPVQGKFIRGKYAGDSSVNRLQFGIEAFYVQEGKGLALEQARNKGQLSAEIALTRWGQAKLCGLK